MPELLLGRFQTMAVEIREGGSTLRNGSAQAVSTQFSIRGLARECRADGESIIIKVGVEDLERVLQGVNS